MNPICNFCNNTEGRCCHEAIRTDNKVKIHIIDPQDEHYNNRADSHVFMLNGLLVALADTLTKAGV